MKTEQAWNGLHLAPFAAAAAADDDDNERIIQFPSPSKTLQ
jgi:hypothetical protein